MSGNGIGFVWYGDFAQEEQIVEGALVEQVETRLVAVHQSQGGRRSKIGEGGGHAVQWVAGGLSCNLLFDHMGFEGPGAAETPERSHHFLNEAELDAIGGLEALEVLGEDGFEALGGLIFEENAAGQQSVAQSILGRTAFAVVRHRTAAAAAVGAGRKNSPE